MEQNNPKNIQFSAGEYDPVFNTLISASEYDLAQKQRKCIEMYRLIEEVSSDSKGFPDNLARTSSDENTLCFSDDEYSNEDVDLYEDMDRHFSSQKSNYLNCQCTLCITDYPDFNSTVSESENILRFSTGYDLFSGFYVINLNFIEVGISRPIFFNKEFIKTYHFAKYLHQFIGINNFDLVLNNRDLYAHHLITNGDTVIIKGGFDKYLADKWSDIMHMLNGNIDSVRKDECKNNHGGHLPRVKPKQETKFKGYKAYINKLNSSVKKAMFRKKEIGPKVENELSENDRDNHIGNFDIKFNPFDDPKYPTMWECSEQNDNGGWSDNYWLNKFPRCDSQCASKEEEKVEIDVSSEYGDCLIDRKYKYYYKFNNDTPVDDINKELFWFGFIPKYKMRKSFDDEITYYFWLIFFTSCLFYYYSELPPILKLYQTFFLFFFNFDIYNYFIVNVLRIILETIFYCFVVVNTMGFMIFGMWFYYILLCIFVWLYKRSKIFTDFTSTRLYRPEIGMTYYKRKSVLRQRGTTNIVNKKIDLRREIDRNFELKQANQRWVLDEVLVKYTDIGSTVNGVFKPIYTVEQRRETTDNIVDLELLCQMMSPKNLTMNVSCTAIAERLMNSTNMGPFINSNKNACLYNDDINYSARLAHCIAMSWRYQALNVDVYDQLFRRDDSVRLISVVNRYSHF